jgi:hypothetical protein
MAQTGEPFEVVIDDMEHGTVNIIRRPSSDLVDTIANMMFSATRSSSPFDVVNRLIGKMCTGWSDIKDDEGRDLRFPNDIGKLPPAVRNVIYDECIGIVEPLIPNLARTGT